MKQHKYSKRKLAKQDAKYRKMRDEFMYPEMVCSGCGEEFFHIIFSICMLSILVYVLVKVV